MTAADHIAARIRREGAVPFEDFVEVALYDERTGFYASGRGAGRSSGDFVTSPETGSLFGLLVARHIDQCWEALGRPDPFLVVEAGAGHGRLAREVLRAEPECRLALRYVLVERSATLRARQHELLDLEPADEALGPFVAQGPDEMVPAPRAGPVLASLDDLPALEFEGLVVANELLDNLPFGVAQWDGARWLELRVGLDPGARPDDPRFAEIWVPAGEPDARELAATFTDLDVPPGTLVPLPRGIEAWIGAAGRVLRGGRMLLLDYFVDAATLVARPPGSWLRTYRGHAPGGAPLDDPGEQDLTSDVVREQLARAAAAAGFTIEHETSQREWCSALGIDDLVAEARRDWDRRAAVGDLEALAARSRVSEAAALTDPAGLGAHGVVVLGRRRAG